MGGQYKFTLDTSKRGNFIQYKAIVCVQFAVVWSTRCFVWFLQLHAALTHFWAQGDKPFFYGACVAGALMSIFNLVTLSDATTAAVKWLPRPMPKSAPASHDPTSPTKRGPRASRSALHLDFGACGKGGGVGKARTKSSFRNAGL